MSLITDKIGIEIAEAELVTQKALSKYPRFFKWYLLLAILAIIPTYQIAKKVSYNIWLKRLEAGLVESHSSFKDPKMPKISALILLPAGYQNYAALCQITNLNLDLSVKNLTYTFNFKNASGQIVKTSSDKTFLLPGQKKYLIVPKISSLDIIATTTVEIGDNISWQKQSDTPKIKLLTSLPNGYQQLDPPNFVVEGSVTNNSPYNLGTIKIGIVVFNKDGKIVAASKRDEFTINSGEKRAFKQLWPSLYVQNLGHIEIIAETNTLDKNNITLPKTDASTPTNSSDLSRPE